MCSKQIKMYVMYRTFILVQYSMGIPLTWYDRIHYPGLFSFQIQTSQNIKKAHISVTDIYL